VGVGFGAFFGGGLSGLTYSDLEKFSFEDIDKLIEMNGKLFQSTESTEQ